MGQGCGGGEFDGMHGDVKTFQMKGASEELVSALAARLKGPRRLLSAGSTEWMGEGGVEEGGKSAEDLPPTLKHLCRPRFKQTLAQ